MSNTFGPNTGLSSKPSEAGPSGMPAVADHNGFVSGVHSGGTHGSNSGAK